MTDTGRNYLVGVRITERENKALERKVQELREAGDKAVSKSTLAHEMMRRGNLDSLVAFYFGSSEELNPQNQGL
jgi:hypothetical protein